MKVLIAEDEHSISMQYEIVLKERGHEVIVTKSGEECMKVYRASLGLVRDDYENTDTSREFLPPFDAVILDYRMPKKDGLAVALEIFELCPSQRIVFASAYTAETLIDAVKNLHKQVELVEKPFDLEYFIDVVEDDALSERLERLNDRVKDLRRHDV
jgi:DNA-binding NtrC family response regulator